MRKCMGSGSHTEQVYRENAPMTLKSLIAYKLRLFIATQKL